MITRDKIDELYRRMNAAVIKLRRRGLHDKSVYVQWLWTSWLNRTYPL